MDSVVTGLAALLVIEGFAAVAAVFYIIRVYLGSERTSTVFRMLVQADMVKVVAGLWIAALVIYFYAAKGSPVPPWTRPITALALIALLFPPIYHAVTIYRLRRRYGDSTPPPLHAED